MTRALIGSSSFMTYTEFKKITYHTPLTEELREKIAKAYGKSMSSILVDDISIQDAEVLYSLGYRLKMRNDKMEIQL